MRTQQAFYEPGPTPRTMSVPGDALVMSRALRRKAGTSIRVVGVMGRAGGMRDAEVPLEPQVLRWHMPRVWGLWSCLGHCLQLC